MVFRIDPIDLVNRNTDIYTWNSGYRGGFESEIKEMCKTKWINQGKINKMNKKYIFNYLFITSTSPCTDLRIGQNVRQHVLTLADNRQRSKFITTIFIESQCGIYRINIQTDMPCVSTYRIITNNEKYPPYVCGLILYKTKDCQCW